MTGSPPWVHFHTASSAGIVIPSRRSREVLLTRRISASAVRRARPCRRSAVLAVAAQGPSNHSRNWLGRMRTFAQQLQQPVAHKALEKFIIERNDQFVAARVALTAGAPKELAVDATELVVFRQDDMQAQYDGSERTRTPWSDRLTGPTAHRGLSHNGGPPGGRDLNPAWTGKRTDLWTPPVRGRDKLPS